MVGVANLLSPIAFRSNIFPAMRLFHMLFAIAFPFRGIGAWGEHAFELNWFGRMLVGDMAISLLFCGPSKIVVFACFFMTLPWSGMYLFMFGKIARPFERLATIAAC